MNVEQKDFSGLLVPVHTLQGKQDPFDKFDIFKKHQEFYLPISLPRRLVLKYIVYCYDQRSPFLHENIWTQKQFAAKEAGFEANDENKFLEIVENMIIGENPSINAMICRYVSLSNNIKWMKYVTLQEAYFKASQQLMEGESKKIKELTDIESELEKTQNQLISYDNAANLKKQLFKLYIEEKVELRPEDIARKFVENPIKIPV